MAGIAGVANPGRQSLVAKMLGKIAHRGKARSRIVEGKEATLGARWPKAGPAGSPVISGKPAVWDAQKKLPPDEQALAAEPGPFALAVDTGDGIFLARDSFGVRPLYYGDTKDGELCFASEVKALLPATRNVKEFPAGFKYEPQSGFQPFANLEPGPMLQDPPEQIALELQRKLERAVARRVSGDVTGSWLSGGLDSSGIVALARPHVRTLYTFAGGLPGAPDLEYARQMATALDCEHHEIVLTEAELIAALPEVIAALESFDALLVRSSIVNYLVARRAADWIETVLSGEGGDELFAGYAYLEGIPEEQLSAELLDITRRLHNTALQRVDRSASAHGIMPFVPFLEKDVATYVMRIPVEWKRGPREAPIEKWILRKALEGWVPDTVLWRKKAKFWEGAGVGALLSQHAERTISDRDFLAERRLPNGWLLNSKEELMYYRLFKAHFGEFEDLSWMGRTKGAPTQEELSGPKETGGQS